MKILCPHCDARTRLVTEHRTMDADDGTPLAWTDELYECVACGERFYTQAQSLESCRNYAASIRVHEHLLTPTDIRGIRVRFGLSQVGLEALLGVGAKTVVRWERGTVCQSRAVDLLLRILESCGPSVLERAKRRNIRREGKAPPAPAVAEPRSRYRAGTKPRRRT
jgi:putative zinc finger/helix-turn-helix YgiT family protein